MQRRLAHALRVSLPELASASGIPLHKVERALNRRRSDPRTLDRIRCTLGATETDVQAAQLVGLTRVCDPLRDDEAAP